MAKKVHVPQFDKTVTFQVPKKYGNSEKYRVDMLLSINNESDPAVGLPDKFVLIRRRKDGKIEAIYDR